MTGASNNNYNWNRPKTPDNAYSLVAPFGGVLIFVGLLLVVFNLNPVEADNPGLSGSFLLLGNTLFGLGFLQVLTGLIINEIRRFAFEATVRAAEANARLAAQSVG